jgi:hypothetical protein
MARVKMVTCIHCGTTENEMMFSSRSCPGCERELKLGDTVERWEHVDLDEHGRIKR